MSLSRTWFEPCPFCDTPEDCGAARECAEGFDCEHAVGFNFTQESEDQHNDPRRR